MTSPSPLALGVRASARPSTDALEAPHTAAVQSRLFLDRAPESFLDARHAALDEAWSLLFEAVEDFPPGTEAMDDVRAGHEVVVERQGSKEGRTQPLVESVQDPGGVLGRIAQRQIGPIDHRRKPLVVAQQVGGPKIAVHQPGFVASKMFACLGKEPFRFSLVGQQGQDVGIESVHLIKEPTISYAVFASSFRRKPVKCRDERCQLDGERLSTDGVDDTVRRWVAGDPCIDHGAMNLAELLRRGHLDRQSTCQFGQHARLDPSMLFDLATAGHADPHIIDADDLEVPPVLDDRDGVVVVVCERRKAAAPSCCMPDCVHTASLSEEPEDTGGRRRTPRGSLRLAGGIKEAARGANVLFLIQPLETLPADLAELVAASEREDFGALATLRDAWQAGTNRFDRECEILLAARRDGQLVGICGLNRDPYCEDPRVGRVRHLYVHPGARRTGVATQLLEEVLRRAIGNFELLRLRTHRQDAAAFYLARGFAAVDDEPDCTHLLRLTDPRRGS